MSRATAIVRLLPAPVDAALTMPMRFRTDEAMEAELNELEALLRGAGYRHLNRSAILRALVAKGLSDIAAEAPKPAHEHGPFVGTPLGEACRGCGRLHSHL